MVAAGCRPRLTPPRAHSAGNQLEISPIDTQLDSSSSVGTFGLLNVNAKYPFTSPGLSLTP